MKTILNFTLLISVFFVISCSNNNSSIVPTGNTQQYFKYTVDGGTERIFDSYAIGRYVPSSATTNPYESFKFRASTPDTQAGSFFVDASFTFQDWPSFLNTSNFLLGVSDGTSANFYFSELSSGNLFFPDLLIIPSNPINCLVTIYPVNVGDYMEFTFSGNYNDTSNPANLRSVSGSGRILRETDY